MRIGQEKDCFYIGDMCMEEKKDYMEIFIKEELEREAGEIRRDNAGAEAVPGEVKMKVRQRLEKEIEDYEWKKKYPELSEGELRALRLGQEMIEKEEAKAKEEESEKEAKKGTVRKKRGFRFYLGLAAVFVLVLAVSMTSFGGAERVVRFVKSMVGEREVVKVNSGDDNLVIEEDNVEDAYQVIRDEFGVEPVKIMSSSLKGLRFGTMEFDKALQLAELSYIYNGENIGYYISASYRDSSWGMDVEDYVVDEYQLQGEKCLFEIKEYEIKDTKTNRYSASFRYRGIEYFLIATMEKEEFELIIKNLHFVL